MTDTPPPAAASAGPLSESDERLWGSLAHFGGIILGFLAPLIIWLVFKDRSAKVDAEGKEALNFQLTVLIGYVVSALLMIVLIGFLTYFAVWVVAIVFSIMGGVKVQGGESYRYPVSIRFIK